MTALRTAGAFLRVDLLAIRSYPMALIVLVAGALMPVFIYFFVARLLDVSGPTVGHDYFTFVAIGLLGLQLLSAGLQGFGQELEFTIQQGRFEMLLVEPVAWRWIPYGLVQVPILLRSASAGLIVAVSLGLGAGYRAAGIGAALAIGALGVAAGFAVGLLAASVKVLAKRGDPVLTFYMFAASVLSGVYFPLDVLPAPLRVASWALPHTYVVAGMRRALMPAGAALPGPGTAEAVLALIAFNIIMLPLATRTFGRALDVGRRAGLLGSY